MTPALYEYLPLIATAPDGIQKLRSLILELAIRGKLLQQDLSKTLETSIEISSDSELATPFPISRNWSWVPLKATGRIFNGNSINSSEKASKFMRPDGLPYIATKDIGYGLDDLDYNNGVRIPEGEPKFRLAKKGTVFICAEGGSAGKKCGLTDQDVYFGNKLYALEPHKCVDSKYVLYVYMTETFRVEFEKSMTGIIGGISSSKFGDLPFPLPPLAEQLRIVTKVDELMALCDRLESEQTDSVAAHTQLVETLLGALTQSTNAADFEANWKRIAEHFDTLFTTEASIDSLQKTILQLAVMGRLVPQDQDDEPASDLVKRIVASEKGKKSKSFLPIGESDRPFALPESWHWVRFGSITENRLGKMLDASKNRGNLKPYLRNTNVQWWQFELDDIKEMRLSEDELHEFRLRNGDLLICEGGEPGRCAIWRSDIDEMYFQKALHRARPLGGCISEYLQIVLRQDAASGALNAYFTGATIKHFPGDKLNSYLLPLPPVAEQHRIVAKADELLTLCETLKTQLVSAQKAQSILSNSMMQRALEAA